MAMQVVYSAGTSPLSSPIANRRYNYSPRSSPRGSPKTTPRGVEGWRPVLPGYKPRGSSGSVTVQRTVEVHHRDTDTTLKDAIPLMTRPLAITCLILNILLPGLGELIRLFHFFIAHNACFLSTADQSLNQSLNGRDIAQPYIENGPCFVASTK